MTSFPPIHFTFDASGNPTGFSEYESGDTLSPVYVDSLYINGSSDALDEYEEGQWTATLTPSTSGTITLNTLYDHLTYIRVGNLVVMGGNITVASVSSPVGAGFRLNLPYVAKNEGTTGNRAGGVVYHDGSGNNIKYGYVVEGEANFYLGIDASTVIAGDVFIFNVSYRTT